MNEFQDLNNKEKDFLLLFYDTLSILRVVPANIFFKNKKPLNPPLPHANGTNSQKSLLYFVFSPTLHPTLKQKNYTQKGKMYTLTGRKKTYQMLK